MRRKKTSREGRAITRSQSLAGEGSGVPNGPSGNEQLRAQDPPRRVRIPQDQASSPATKRSAKMNSLIRFFFKPAPGPASIFLVRLAAGLIFFTQGILKYTDPGMGVARFTRIGFPHPYFTAHFVGTCEIVCGFLVLIGLWTRASAVPLLIVISTAIATTKIPELFRANQGFWFMVSDARTDFAMLCSLLFLIATGGGNCSLDARRQPQQPPQ
jgi:putative oxidoreductase